MESTTPFFSRIEVLYLKADCIEVYSFTRPFEEVTSPDCNNNTSMMSSMHDLMAFLISMMSSMLSMTCLRSLSMNWHSFLNSWNRLPSSSVISFRFYCSNSSSESIRELPSSPCGSSDLSGRPRRRCSVRMSFTI